ncbi:MAG TPA: tetratricopeptide repeat protein [Polyangiaceae bacterium]|nr:tetratricopeptide repeat protein [Polyangiaceae bacterium]
MDDVSEELEEIKREIVESRSLTIKTNNLVNALSADVNSIAKRQQNYERRINWNSSTAYVVTVLLLLLIGKWVLDARVDAERSRTKDDLDRLSKLDKEAGSEQHRQDLRQRTERQAFAFYQLIGDNKRREIIDQYPQMQELDLSKTERALFEQAVANAKSELSLIAYQEGLDDIRAGRWHEAEVALRESLKDAPDATHAPEATYNLARALRTLGEQREAIPLLLKLSEASADKEVTDDATFLLAQAQEDVEAWNDAKSTWRTFIRRFPRSAMINDARANLADLQMHH